MTLAIDGASEKLRIMFVDDEQSVLDGLRRSLRGHRARWDMTFVSDPRAALRQVEAASFDVVVSDMRMPVMNGADLLEAVRERCPGALRIMLSGHAEVSSIMKSVGPSHQFLSKPCDVGALANTIERSQALAAHLGGDELRCLIGGIETLPSLPSVYRDLVDAIREDRSMREIGAIISRDIAMTAKLLKVVNSSYFGPARAITDPAQAAMMLGVELIQGLVLGGKIFEQLPASLPKSEVEALWLRSSRVVAVAQQIARIEELGDALKSQTLISAMLADVGMLVLLSHRNEQMLEVERALRDSKVTRAEAERSVFGATHGDVGAHLAALWGFAAPVVEAIAYHDRPSLVSHRDIAPVTFVHASDALIGEHDAWAASDVDRESGRDREPGLVDGAYLQAVGLVERFSAWREICAALSKGPSGGA